MSRWSRSEQLLAGVADLIADGFWRNEAMWAEADKRRPHPDPVPRPGIDTTADRREAFLSRFAAL